MGCPDIIFALIMLISSHFIWPLVSNNFAHLPVGSKNGLFISVSKFFWVIC